MKNLKEREEVIEYSIKLNTTNLSPLRSGNISVRGIEDGIEGFFITPSGKKYESLKPEDIVFLSLTEEKDFLSWFNSGKNPSSEWRFHQDIYKNKWEAKAIVHAHSPYATAWAQSGLPIPCYGTTHADYWENNIPITRELYDHEIKNCYEKNIG